MTKIAYNCNRNTSHL